MLTSEGYVASLRTLAHTHTLERCRPEPNALIGTARSRQ